MKEINNIKLNLEEFFKKTIPLKANQTNLNTIITNLKSSINSTKSNLLTLNNSINNIQPSIYTNHQKQDDNNLEEQLRQNNPNPAQPQQKDDKSDISQPRPEQKDDKSDISQPRPEQKDHKIQPDLETPTLPQPQQKDKQKTKPPADTDQYSNLTEEDKAQLNTTLLTILGTVSTGYQSTKVDTFAGITPYKADEVNQKVKDAILNAVANIPSITVLQITSLISKLSTAQFDVINLESSIPIEEGGLANEKNIRRHIEVVKGNYSVYKNNLYICTKSTEKTMFYTPDDKGIINIVDANGNPSSKGERVNNSKAINKKR